MSHDLGVPPGIKEEVVKLDLSAYSVKVPPFPPSSEKTSWDKSKDALKGLFDDINKELTDLRIENMKIEEEYFFYRKGVGVLFEKAWSELVGADVMPHMKNEFKKKMGL
jgi:hypothetical protein